MATLLDDETAREFAILCIKHACNNPDTLPEIVKKIGALRELEREHTDKILSIAQQIIRELE